MKSESQVITMGSSVLFLCLLALAINAVTSSSDLSRRVVHHGSRSVPRGWTLHRRADPDTLLPLRLTLAQSNVQNLDTYLLDIADPMSPNYGQHWSPARVAETFRPSKESIDTVRSWLVHDLGVDSRKIQLNRNGHVIQVNVTVAEAEDILGTEYHIYRLAGEEQVHERLGCHQGYSLPEHVSKHVDFVQPTVHFGRPRLGRRDSSRLSGVPASVRGTRVPKTLLEASVTSPPCDMGTFSDLT